MEICLRLWRGVGLAGRRHLLRRSSKYRLESGGAIIAIAGGDGAGKSTVVEGLSAWLSRDFATTSVHLGKPAWSWTTVTVRAILKVGQLLGLYPTESTFRATLEQRSLVSTGYPWLLREFCRARDRYASYVEARRYAAAGGLLISDRFPLPQVRLMDGPLAQRFLDQRSDRPRDEAFLSPQPGHWLARALVRLEASYYQHIAPPEVLIVLRVDPEIAVRRRSDEDAIPVRERSTEIWQLDWQHTNAHVVDASKSKAEVLAEVKALVWAEL
jgi:thymidylate kinase